LGVSKIFSEQGGFQGSFADKFFADRTFPATEKQGGFRGYFLKNFLASVEESG